MSFSLFLFQTLKLKEPNVCSESDLIWYQSLCRRSGMQGALWLPRAAVRWPLTPAAAGGSHYLSSHLWQAEDKNGVWAAESGPSSFVVALRPAGRARTLHFHLNIYSSQRKLSARPRPKAWRTDQLSRVLGGALLVKKTPAVTFDPWMKAWNIMSWMSL